MEADKRSRASGYVLGFFVGLALVPFSIFILPPLMAWVLAHEEDDEVA